MGAYADRAHARAAAAMGDAEGLVQIHVRNIRTNFRGLGNAHLRVQVGAVHVHLTAVVVHDLTGLFDAFLIHAVSRRIGDHQRSERVAMVFGLGLQVRDIDIAIVVAAYQDNFHADHLRASGIGAVGRGWDQANCSLSVAAA